jgi:hypothetical protein
MWTDAELDRALADQPPGPAFTDDVRDRAWSRLRAALDEDAGTPATVVPLTPAAGRARRTPRTWWAVAACVVLLAAVAVGATGESPPAASAAAANHLQRASGGTSQVRVGPGRYRYTAVRSWSLGSAQTGAGKPLSVLRETLVQTWIPYDRADRWRRTTSITGRTKWLVGDAELARAEGDGGLLDIPGRTTVEGPCGDFPGDNGQLGGDPDAARPCHERAGDWYAPTPRFLASLPTDPERLYRQLRDAAGEPGEVLRMAAAALAADASPAVRSTVYRALMRMPGLDVTEGTANLDGQRGVALGVDDAATRQEIIIDPADGRFIGERFSLTRPGTGIWAGLPAGTVADYSSVHSAVVDSAGATG